MFLTEILRQEVTASKWWIIRTVTMVGVIEQPIVRYIPTVRKNRSDIIYTRNYTNEEKDMARRISIASILRSKGEKLKSSGSNYI